ncbi:unnamed protein product [Cercospora beticola]|nr:unnamed protein product [Cercospora beticola]
MPTTTSRSEHARQDDYTASVVAAERRRLIMASPRPRIPTTQLTDGETACVMAGLGVVVNLNESPFSASRGNTFAVQCLKEAAVYGGNEAERTRSTGEISHHRPRAGNFCPSPLAALAWHADPGRSGSLTSALRVDSVTKLPPSMDCIAASGFAPDVRTRKTARTLPAW